MEARKRRREAVSTDSADQDIHTFYANQIQAMQTEHEKQLRELHSQYQQQLAQVNAEHKRDLRLMARVITEVEETTAALERSLPEETG